MSSPLLSTLGIVCPVCDRLNPARSPKCVACGADLFDASGPGRPTEAAPPAATAHPSIPARSAPPLVQSVLTAQTRARPKPPILARHPGTPSPNPAVLPPLRPDSPRPAATEPATSHSELPRKGPESPAGGTAAFVLAVIAGSAKGERYPVPISGCWVGRNRGNILFPEDVFVSGNHAALTVHEGRLRVRDEGTASGVFVSIAGQEMIPHGALFSVGRRLLRYVGHLQPAVAAISGKLRVYGAPLPPGQPPYGVEEVLVGGRTGRAVISAGPSLSIGQMNCDLSFPHDDSVAAKHCEVAPGGEGAVLRDLSGAMGTFVRISPGSDRLVRPGDRLRIGQQILQVEAA
jgi:pSer/pThr/pTyr-binding forkhead associated (FHA) protein